jgi:hypothetical protein
MFTGTLWDDPANADLRSLRRENPNAIMAGDVVVIPDLRQTSSTIATGARHRFRRRGVPAKLRFQVLDDGEPVANAPFVLEVDGRTIEGKTTGEGLVEASIQPSASHARLRVQRPAEDDDDEGVLEYDFQLGQLDPADTLSGARQRLVNLGLLPPGGHATESAMADALRTFQALSGLSPTGQLDGATTSKLAHTHDHE